MTKKFSTYLLMGKVASLPFLTQSARAEFVLPTIPSTSSSSALAYTDITTSTISIIEMPDTLVKLQTVKTDTAASTSTLKSAASAMLCPSPTTSALPTTMSVVITGVNAGDSVYLFGALDKNYSQYTSLNSRLTIGDSGLVNLGWATVTASKSTAISTVTIPIDLTANSALLRNGTFYLQAISIPASSTGYSSWRISELDQISTGQIVRDSYGNVTSYCA